MIFVKRILRYAVVAVIILGLGYFAYEQQLKVKLLQGEVTGLRDEVTGLRSQEEQDKTLGQYAINMMYKTRAADAISDARKQILARAIVRVTNDVFVDVEHRKAFIAVIAIESEFQRTAQSPTGPKGLSQVAKAAFTEGMANCGVSDLKDDDVWETDLNLYAGACYFRAVMEQNNNDPYIAIVAYNQGPNSKDIKSYSKSGYMETLEALKYVARFNYLKRTVKEEKAPDAPAIEIGSAKPSSIKVEDKKIIASETK